MKQAEELSNDEISRIAALAEWGREYISERRQSRAPVIILTGTELFAPYSIHEAWEKAGGKRAEIARSAWVRTDNLRVLADLTQQLYLNMPSYFFVVTAYNSSGTESSFSNEVSKTTL